jgi:hypothetical protein
LDVPTVVLPVVVSDSLGDFVEPELLLSLIVSPSLEDHVGSAKHFSNSVEWEFRNKVEWSVDVETEVIIHSLGLCLGSLVKIENLPFLVLLSSVVSNTNGISFFVLAVSNIKNLVV